MPTPRHPNTVLPAPATVHHERTVRASSRIGAGLLRSAAEALA
jgi:hypothetical protein